MKRFNPDIVEAQTTAIAAAAGVAPEDAAILADSLVNADIYGVSTHGVSRLNIYIRRIQKGLIDPQATLAVDRNGRGVSPSTPATAWARFRRSRRSV
jgi:LDH2 family malate/lactate/ureidoglycolate dehydrogenase